MFPITLYGTNSGGGGGIAMGFHALFMQHKPKELTWFETDVAILGPTYVRFDVFERTHHFGLERETWYRDPNPIWTKTVNCDASVTRDYILREVLERAEDQRKQELQDIEDRIIAGYANEIFDTIYKDA